MKHNADIQIVVLHISEARKYSPVEVDITHVDDRANTAHLRVNADGRTRDFRAAAHVVGWRDRLAVVASLGTYIPQARMFLSACDSEVDRRSFPLGHLFLSDGVVVPGDGPLRALNWMARLAQRMPAA